MNAIPKKAPDYYGARGYRHGPAVLNKLSAMLDADIMLARTRAAQRGAKPAEIQRAIHELETNPT